VAVVHKLYNTNHEARLNFVLVLLCVYDGETDIALFLFSSGYKESQNNRQWSAENPTYCMNAIACYIWCGMSAKSGSVSEYLSDCNRLYSFSSKTLQLLRPETILCCFGSVNLSLRTYLISSQ